MTPFLSSGKNTVVVGRVRRKGREYEEIIYILYVRSECVDLIGSPKVNEIYQFMGSSDSDTALAVIWGYYSSLYQDLKVNGEDYLMSQVVKH